MKKGKFRLVEGNQPSITGKILVREGGIGHISLEEKADIEEILGVGTFLDFLTGMQTSKIVLVKKDAQISDLIQRKMFGEHVSWKEEARVLDKELGFTEGDLEKINKKL